MAIYGNADIGGMTGYTGWKLDLGSQQKLLDLEIVHWCCAISRLARSFRILRLRSTISRLRKFLDCAEHIYMYIGNIWHTLHKTFSKKKKGRPTVKQASCLEYMYGQLCTCHPVHGQLSTLYLIVEMHPLAANCPK